MSVEENLRLLKESAEAFNARDWDRYYELHAESIVRHDPAFPEPIKGRVAHREFVMGGQEAFPDLRAEEVRAFGQGDWVSAEFAMTGTHTGPLAMPDGQTIPATNKSFRVNVEEVLKWEGGQIVEEHAYYDVLGWMTQLGLAP